MRDKNKATRGDEMVPERVSRLLTAYVDGELDRRQRKLLVRLLRRSAEARELLRTLQQDAERLHSLPCPNLGPEFSEQIVHTIARRKTVSPRRLVLSMRSPMPAWLGLATAAAVLLVVGLGSYVYFA